MISDSTIWKDSLLRFAAKLRKYSRKREPGESIIAKYEQTIMLGFYSIRKLIESHKLSDLVASQQLELTAYAWSGKDVTWLNSHRIGELYTGYGEQVSRELVFVCNQIIHSYVWMPLWREQLDRLDGIAFTSDRHRDKFMYQLQLDRIIALFRHVGKDYPSHIHRTYNPQTKDYDVRSWSESETVSHPPDPHDGN